MYSSRHIDDLLREFQNRKEVVLNDPTPSTITQFLQSDPGCMRNMGNTDGENLFSCDNCEYMGRLTKLSLGVPKEIKIQTGAYEGRKMKIHETPSALHGCKLDEYAHERHATIDTIEGVSECGISGKSKIVKYLASDMWLNETLINWQIGRIFEHKGLPHINPIITNFVCGNNGYVIDFDDVKPLMEKTKISEVDAYCILQQLVSIFLTLKPYRFVHGSCTIDKLGFSDRGCGYASNDMEVTGPFTLYLGGFKRSSINVKDTRLIPSVNGAGVNLKYSVENFHPVIKKFKMGKVDMTTHKTSGGPLIYSIEGTGISLLTTMRYSGYPIFGGSYDLYSIIVSLLSWGPFRCAVENSEYLTAIIRNIFVDHRNLPTIKEENIQCSIKLSLSLSGVWMYCDAAEKLRDLLNAYRPTGLR
jgi:hypothetical protein